MKILFTGATSFSGSWFVTSLAEAGHEVVCPLLRPEDAYEGVRKQRLDKVKQVAEVRPETPFGSDSFLELVQSRQWDLLCHHAADVRNYKSPDFDAVAALQNNTLNLAAVLDSLKTQGCEHILLTGTVFEQNEGKGSEPLEAFSPYGLSKGLTYQSFRYYCRKAGLHLGKFVISNPFGPLEEPRFTSFLARNWLAKQQVTVSMPDYIRDNIHVGLLARVYTSFAEKLKRSQCNICLNPSGYVGSTGSFTQRFAEELKTRFDLPCRFELGVQTDFSEPLERVNTDSINAADYNWNESQAWDELANFYQQTYAPVSA